MRALRFHPNGPAQALAEGDWPTSPGGEVWVDLERDELAGADTRGALGRWLGALHPLTGAMLGRSTPTHLATAQQGYVHVRLQALRAPSPAPVLGPVRGQDTRGPEGERLPKGTLDVVAGPGFSLTVRPGGLETWDDLWAAYDHDQRRAPTVDFALYHALAVLVERYRRAGAALTDQAEDVDQRLVRLSERRILAEVVRVRRHAMDLRDVLAPAHDGLQLLARGPDGPVRSENRPYFDDLRRETADVLGSIDGARDAMGEAVEAYTAVQSTQMNRVMQLFTVLAVVIAPPMLVASIYGMNFNIPEYEWHHGYSFALGLMFALMFGCYLYVRWRRWL